MNVAFADLDSDIQSLEQLLLYVLDIYWQQNNRNDFTARDINGALSTVPIVSKTEGVISSNGVVFNEYFVRVPLQQPTGAGGEDAPPNDYPWRYGDHVETRVLDKANPAPFPVGWKTANLEHAAGA